MSEWSAPDDRGRPPEGASPEREAYSAPKVRLLGTVAELTRNNPGVGADGGVVFVDDTFS